MKPSHRNQVFFECAGYNVGHADADPSHQDNGPTRVRSLTSVEHFPSIPFIYQPLTYTIRYRQPQLPGSACVSGLLEITIAQWVVASVPFERTPVAPPMHYL